MDLNAHSSPLVFMPKRAGGEAITTTRASPSGHHQDSEQIHGLVGPWEYVQLPGSKIDAATSPGPNEEDGNPAFLPEANGIRPPEPDKSETNVYGIINATAKAHDRWLLPAAEAICFGNNPKTAQTWRDYTRAYKLLPKLERQVLICDIETSSIEVQERLAQNVVLLLLHLGHPHSENTQICLQSDREGLIARLVHALRIPFPPKRPKDDEIQTTTLVRALLEMSGGRVDYQQQKQFEAYTIDQNVELLASVFDVITVKGFRDADTHEMTVLISQSPIFSQTNPQDLHNRTMTMKQSLRLGFEEGHLNLPPQILVGFGAEQVNRFHRYLSHTYHDIPALESPQNNQLLLLTWAANLSSLNTAASSRQLDVIQAWARSDDGDTLYNEMAQSAQGSQSVQQLTLITAAMLSYSRLVPDNLDHSSRPSTGSYLADLDYHFGGHALGNRGSVAERMAFALIRVLLTLGDQYGRITTFLVATVGRQPPVLHALDGLSDQYFNFRVGGYDHENAFQLVTTEASWWLPESRTIRVAQTVEESYVTEVINNTLLAQVVNTFSPTAGRRLAPPHFPPDNYKLVRLSMVKEEDVAMFVDTHAGELREVPSVVPVGDGSYEIVVLDSHCDILRDRVNAWLPGSELELDYDPAQPTDADLRVWDKESARELRQDWFSKRAKRVVDEGWLPAAAYYAHRLKLLRGPCGPVNKVFQELGRQATEIYTEQSPHGQEGSSLDR